MMLIRQRWKANTLGFRDKHRGSQELACRDGPPGIEPQLVLGVQDADDMVTITFDHWKTRVRRADGKREKLAWWLRDIDHVHLRSRHHDVARRQVRDLKDALNHGDGFSV